MMVTEKSSCSTRLTTLFFGRFSEASLSCVVVKWKSVPRSSVSVSVLLTSG